MKKIFITIPWFLPAFRAGGPIQSVANLVKEYSEEVEYYIFCGDTDLHGGALENITTGRWLPRNNCTQVWYAVPEKLSDTLVQQVAKVKPDILYIIGMYSWHFNMVPLLFCKGPKKILSVRGMLHPGALSQKKWKKKIYLSLFKLLEYPHKVTFHATDAEEQKYIRENFGAAAAIAIAGNFPNTCGALPLAPKQPGILRLVSIALISPMKNIVMVLEALKNVEAHVQYDIYGPVKDTAYNALCMEQAKLLPGNIRVVMHGEVEPSQVKEVLQQSHVFVLPSKSENFGHAIYEALSAGRPVITSHFTPWKNLEASRAGINVDLETTAALEEAIKDFAVMDGGVLSQWSSGATAYAAHAIDLGKLREQYRELFAASPSPCLPDSRLWRRG